MASVAEILTLIANSIRAKTGITDKMKIEEMPGFIDEITTGDLIIDPAWTDWRYFSDKNNRNSLVPLLNYTDTSHGTDFSYMFYNCDQLIHIPDIDTSNGYDFSRMFYSNHALLKSPSINTSNGKIFNYMYNCCCNMTETPQLDTANGVDFKLMYWNCQVMKDPLVMNVPKGKGFSGLAFNSYLLPSAEFTNMEVSNVNETAGMFGGCRNLKAVDGAVMGQLGGAGWMFRGCGNLQTIKGFKINPLAKTFMWPTADANYPLPQILDVWTETFEWCNELVTLEMTGENKWSGLNLRYSKKLSKESIINVVNTLSDETTGESITLSFSAVDSAFVDGTSGYEWYTVYSTKPNWTIALV